MYTLYFIQSRRERESRMRIYTNLESTEKCKKISILFVIIQPPPSPRNSIIRVYDTVYLDSLIERLS